MKALNATHKSAVGFFLNIGCAALVIHGTGMRQFADWLLLSWCVVCMVGCAYYVQDDIKQALKREEEEDAA